jgi:hypothetical protein
MRTLQEKYTAIQQGKFDKANFIREAKYTYPDFISPANSYDDIIRILKNKGVLTENTEPTANYSLYQIDLGTRIELEKIGLPPGQTPTQEEYNKARTKVFNNLKKDSNFYTAVEKKKRSDLPQYVDEKRSNLVDTANGMKKVKLNEHFAKFIKEIVER